MTMSAAIVTPARLHLIDLSTGEDFEALFNPEQVTEEIQVAYSRLVIPGMSHQPLQYSNTGNEGLQFDLYSVGHTPGERERVEDFRRFLQSLCYPKGDAGTIDDGAPPRVLFVWPRVWTFTCVITHLRFVHSQFTVGGQISRSMASVTIEEIRDIRLTSDDVRRHGTRRSSSGGGVEST